MTPLDAHRDEARTGHSSSVRSPERTAPKAQSFCSFRFALSTHRSKNQAERLALLTAPLLGGHSQARRQRVHCSAQLCSVLIERVQAGGAPECQFLAFAMNPCCRPTAVGGFTYCTTAKKPSGRLACRPRAHSQGARPTSCAHSPECCPTSRSPPIGTIRRGFGTSAWQHRYAIDDMAGSRHPVAPTNGQVAMATGQQSRQNPAAIKVRPYDVVSTDAPRRTRAPAST